MNITSKFLMIAALVVLTAVSGGLAFTAADSRTVTAATCACGAECKCDSGPSADCVCKDCACGDCACSDACKCDSGKSEDCACKDCACDTPREKSSCGGCAEM